LNLGFALVGYLSVAIGFLFIFGNLGGRATSRISVGHSSWTFTARLGAVFIFNGLMITLLGFLM
jgi:hypothetical protein